MRADKSNLKAGYARGGRVSIEVMIEEAENLDMERPAEGGDDGITQR